MFLHPLIFIILFPNPIVWIVMGLQEVLGTANSIGCTVDGKKPKQIQKEIANGTIVLPQ